MGLVTTAFPLERVYVSIPRGGTGNGSISHLLGSVCTGDTPKSPAQISNTDTVSQTLSAVVRQRASRKSKLSFTTAAAAMFSSFFIFFTAATATMFSSFPVFSSFLPPLMQSCFPVSSSETHAAW